MPETFSDRVSQYIETVVQKLAPLSTSQQNGQLKIVEAKCAAKADPEMTKRIMATIREKLMSSHETTPSVITGLSITGTMINGPSAKKRPTSSTAVKPVAKKTKPAAPPSVVGRPLSDGFIVDDTGEGTLIEEDEDEDDDDDDDDEEEDSEEEEIDPVFDHRTYTNDKGKVEFEDMEEAVRREVENRRQDRAKNLLGGRLATHVLPEDDQAFFAIRAKHTLHQYVRSKAQIAELTKKLEESTKQTDKKLFAARLASLKKDAAEQLSIIRQGGMSEEDVAAAA